MNDENTVARERQKKHDKRMIITLIIAIGIGLHLEWPFNAIQTVVCGLSIAWRIPRMIANRK